MANVTVESDSVKIVFAFLDRLFGLNGVLQIPLAHIIGIGPGRVADGAPRRFRMPAIRPPRPKMAGIYINELGHTLWDVQNMDKAVAIYFVGETYFAAIVEVPDPDAIIDVVTRALEAHRARR